MSELELEEYLCRRYSVPKLSVHIKKRLQEAYDGHQCVKPERLLSEWKTMESSLNRERAKNVAKGNDMTGMALLGYDLTIVLSKYDSYMRYITVAEKQNQEVKDMGELLQMTRNVSHYDRPKNDDYTDVSDLVAEFFAGDYRY